MADVGDGPDTESLLRLSVREVPGALILSAAGEIDLLTARRFRAAVSECLSRSDSLVVLNLVEVTFMGSAGLAALVGATEESEGSRHKAPMRLVVDENKPVVRPIQVTGLDHLLALYPSIEAALAV